MTPPGYEPVQVKKGADGEPMPDRAVRKNPAGRRRLQNER